MVDPANFASEIKGIYNIENNNAYREIHATMENSGRLRSDIFAL